MRYRRLRSAPPSSKIPLNPPFSKGEIRFPPLSKRENRFPTLEKGGEGGFETGFCDEMTRYICQRADIIFRLTGILEKKLVETGVLDLFRNVEIPLAEVLADMEMAGIRVNPHILMSLSKEMERDMNIICRRIYTIAGEEFNIN